jgi:L-threonylcarbamoyladenylate synthase
LTHGFFSFIYSANYNNNFALKNMSNNKSYILPLNNINISLAAKMLQNGELVAFPTETVYGLGAKASDEQAVAQIYQYKGRPASNPLIIHVSDVEMAERYGIFNGVAKCLAKSFFPAALTLVVKVRAGTVAENTLAGGDTVALRCPDHSGALSLIQEVGFGIAAPSANISGRVSPTTAQHVLSEFASQKLLILDGGQCNLGLESTVIDCTSNELRILRAGAITEDMIANHLGKASFVAQSYNKKHLTLTDEIIKSPGMLESHYAPSAKVLLNVTNPDANHFYLGFGDYDCSSALSLSLSDLGDLNEAAHNLYDYLRKADEIAFVNNLYIAVAPIPNVGIGVAINDRLNRAAAG